MKPGIPQGTRDFDAATIHKRHYIFNTIRKVFELYGFTPLETPAMEHLDTLLGKYGEEGDKLIFKILNNGLDNPLKEDKLKEGFKKITQGKNSTDITERALRYDLTIPFARYVATNHLRLNMPFKRYQIQPVWRADRPQKGRYREFYQCDADIVGSNSLLNELEFIHLYAAVFEKLQLPVEIRINSRKILVALAIQCGGADKMSSIAIAVDKLDKIGLVKVKQELQQKGLQEDQLSLITSFLAIDGTNQNKIDNFKKIFAGNEIGLEGIKEMEYLIKKATLDTNKYAQLMIDVTLARGLNYYTGTIFEVKAKNVKMGSIGGGGRYDNLTGLFDVPNIPGTGISFGVDRIYDVLAELDAFPINIFSSTTVLFFNLGEPEALKSLEIMQELRSNNISCEIYHEVAKFEKQFKFAINKDIPYIAILGSKEFEESIITVKHLATGTQHSIAFHELKKFFIAIKQHHVSNEVF